MREKVLPCAQIHVHNMETLEAFHPTGDLNVPREQLAPDFCLCLHPLLVLLQLLQVVLQVALRHELLDHEVAFFVSSCVGKELDKVWVVEPLHGVDLLEELLKHLIVFRLIICLQLLSSHPQVAPERGPVHVSKLPRTNLFIC